MVEKKGLAYAKAKADSWFLQEMKKTVLASEMQKQDSNLTVSDREAKARLSQEYKIHVEGTKIAIETELRMEAERERWKYQFEAIRSLQSLEKEKMKMV